MQNILETHNEKTAITTQRKQLNSHNRYWEQLNLSQQFSVYILGQFGYILTSIRYIDNTVLALLTSDNKIATINVEGTINIKSESLYH